MHACQAYTYNEGEEGERGGKGGEGRKNYRCRHTSNGHYSLISSFTRSFLQFFLSNEKFDICHCFRSSPEAEIDSKSCSLASGTFLE